MMLGAFASTSVSLATPATPVTLPRPVAVEVVAAVGSALDNVRVHCGAVPGHGSWSRTSVTS
jgi:hypothetical protein